MQKKATNKNNGNLRTVLPAVIIITSACALVILIDYLNLFGSISPRINYDFQGIFIGFIATLLFFVVAYKLIDKKSIDKQEKELSNKRQVIKSLLLRTYYSCLDNLAIIEDEQIGKIIASRLGGDELISENSAISHFEAMPFANESVLMSLFCSGALDGAYLESYLDIKSSFEKTITSRVFDLQLFKDKRPLSSDNCEETKRKVITEIKRIKKLKT